jgi:hypothetical protein
MIVNNRILSKWIKSIAVFKENKSRLQEQEYRRKRSKLELKEMLQIGGYAFHPIGNDSEEQSFIVFNVPLHSAANICKHYGQSSMVYCNIKESETVDYYRYVDDFSTPKEHDRITPKNHGDIHGMIAEKLGWQNTFTFDYFENKLQALMLRKYDEGKAQYRLRLSMNASAFTAYANRKMLYGEHNGI